MYDIIMKGDEGCPDIDGAEILTYQSNLSSCPPYNKQATSMKVYYHPRIPPRKSLSPSWRTTQHHIGQ